ncbi:MAG: HlyC/CorC family transporter, partial [Gammaproteobacteria bacterium]
MANLSLQFLFGTLGVLLMLSAFFSGSETALMTLNRYRLRHLSKAGHRGAQLAEKLLQRPDRLIGLILLGNNFVNIAASSLATVIALRLGGEGAIAVAAGLLTLVVLIFAEVLPKTLAALRPELLAFPAAWVYTPLQKVAYPVVWMINIVANGLLRVFGVRTDAAEMGHLSTEELRTVVIEAGAMIPKRHQKMLLSVLDLQKVTVEDIMVPRAEILGIDLAEDWDEILTQLLEMQHTRLPVWEDDIDNVVGVIHLRR